MRSISSTSRRRAHATVTALLLSLTLAATAAPAHAASDTTTASSSDSTKTSDSEAEVDRDASKKKATKEVEGKAKAKAKAKKPGKAAKSGNSAQSRRSFAMTWQSNESKSKDRAIYHCARRGEIVGRAHIVGRASAVRFSCRYKKSTEAPYGVKVFQPAGRRVVVKVGTKVVRDYDPQPTGRDVWVVEGNPGGWWRTFIL